MAPVTSAAETLPIATLPVATRACCIRDPRKRRGDPKGPKSAHLRPAKFIALNTECVTSETDSMPGFDGEHWAGRSQAVLFGCSVIGRTSDWQIGREVLFYPDDLPESGLAVLRQYLEDRTYRRGAQPRKEGDAEPDLIWRDERSVVVELLPLSRFLKLFYRIAYEDRGLVVGCNLAFVLTRFAALWRQVKKGRNLGGWHLDIWTYRDPATGEERPSAGWRPGIIVKRAAPDVVFIEFTGRRADREGARGSRYRGEFLDVFNLAHALTGRHWTLTEALTVFTGEVLNEDVNDGRIAAKRIDYCRARVRVTVSLAKTLLELFDRLHPVSRGAGGHLSETHLYSPGGLARAYLAAVGFSPPIVQEDRLGPCVSAFFGGWAEVQLRGRAPVVHVDFRRQYQTVFLLQGLQDLLAAERLEFVDDTEAIRAFVESVSLDDLLQSERWPCLNALCWVKPVGEILPVRAAFSADVAGADRFSLAMAPRYSDEPIAVYLADVIAAKLLSGRSPEIIRAERIASIGRQHLRKTWLVGGGPFDPRKDQFFKVLVEEGERLNGGEGSYAEILVAVRETILPGVKGIGNNGCFGVPIEARQVDLLPGRREEVTLLSGGEPLRAAVAHPEDPGPFACPPLAGLVTAGGRLLLAIVHRLVADRGGIVAACDTDGAHIVATAEGGVVLVETRNADFYEGGPAEPVHALSWAEVEEIAARFEPLNPFDRGLLPGSPLRVQRVNFDSAGRQIPLEGHFISAKRYSLTRPDGSFADFKESILGMLFPPSGGWIEEAWHTLGEMWDFRQPAPRPWLDLPAVRALSATSPAFAQEIKGLPGLRPWNSFLVATAIGRKPGLQESRTEVAVAPFERDPQKWLTLPWLFSESGEPVPFNGPDRDGFVWRLRTLRDFLSSYARHPISEMLAPDGSRCGPYTRGILRRRPVRGGERWLLLKEAAVYGDNPRHAFSVTPPETIRRPNPADWDGRSAVWESAIKPALAALGPSAVGRKMGLAARTARAWAAGERQPEKPGEVARAIVAVAGEAGLGFESDELLRAEQICAELPGRAAAVQCFVSVMVAMLAERLRGTRALARAVAGEGDADLEPTVRRWLALSRKELRPINELNRFVARLAKFSRAEIRKMRRRIVTEPGPAADRQLVVAHLSLAHGAAKSPILAPEETLALPAALAIAAFIALACQAMRPILEATKRQPSQPPRFFSVG
jgi:hypothetical protein